MVSRDFAILGQSLNSPGSRLEALGVAYVIETSEVKGGHPWTICRFSYIDEKSRGAAKRPREYYGLSLPALASHYTP